MYIFPAQFDSHRGPDGVGSHKLTFSVDESIKISFNPMDVKKGTEFILVLVPTAEETNQSEDITGLRLGETQQQTIERFRKRMHAQINELAQYQGKDPREIKELLKAELKAQGRINESTKELDITGLAFAIWILDSKLNAEVRKQ